MNELGKPIWHILGVIMLLFHYCSNEVMLSILQRRQLWLSELTLSNDPMEGMWIRSMFEICCAEKGIEGIRKEKLLSHLDFLLDFFGAAGFCLSESEDLLSQWRAYANNGGGVAIGFNKDYFDALGAIRQDRNEVRNATLDKVSYDIEDQKKIVNARLDPIADLVNMGAVDPLTLIEYASEETRKKKEDLAKSVIPHFLFYLFHVYKLKNPAFNEEREWRLLSYLFKFQDTDQEALAGLCHRALGDRIIPYVPIDLEPLHISSIAKIVIGPRNLTSISIVERLLRSTGWSGVEVMRSAATYR